MIAPPDPKAQSLAVKRAEVEFHNFASLGEPERAHRVYAEENQRRGAILRKHRDWIGPMTPFLEIGANAGHSSYMLCNEFGAAGFALDISADSLRYGRALQESWGMEKAPIRVAGDALHLPFPDNSLRTVLAYQMLSQFMDIEAVIVEVKRVLAPGGLFIFAEEPLRRALSLRLYRAPYWEQMKPWERKLHEWGLLGFVVQDVIGAHQEESFGIRQNHRMNLRHWHDLVTKHFADQRYEIFVPQRGWGERVTKSVAVQLDPHKSEWRAARLLGGTLAGLCRKAGDAPAASAMPADFETLLRCPDCAGRLARDGEETLRCACGYQAALEGGVYNLLNSADKKELYPGDRDDTIDFSLPGHERRLGEGWHDLEGVFGNRYRWIGGCATASLGNVRGGAQQLRIRGFAPESRGNFRLQVTVNGALAGDWRLDRPGLFVCETPVPAEPRYELEIVVTPVWQAPGDSRPLTVNLSLIRLQPLEQG
jgi:ubiquinone/menaquinone biosynthesis C-methylase UbiE